MTAKRGDGEQWFGGDWTERKPEVLATYLTRHTTASRKKPRLHELTRSQYVVHALDGMFERPVFRSSDFVSSAGIPEPTARRVLGVLQKNGLLRVFTPARGRRPAILAFAELLNVCESRDAF